MPPSHESATRRADLCDFCQNGGSPRIYRGYLFHTSVPLDVMSFHTSCAFRVGSAVLLRSFTKGVLAEWGVGFSPKTSLLGRRYRNHAKDFTDYNVGQIFYINCTPRRFADRQQSSVFGELWAISNKEFVVCNLRKLEVVDSSDVSEVPFFLKRAHEVQIRLIKLRLT